MKHSLATFLLLLTFTAAITACTGDPYIYTTSPSTKLSRDDENLTIRFVNMAGWKVAIEIQLDGLPIKTNTITGCNNASSNRSDCVMVIPDGDHEWSPLLVKVGGNQTVTYRLLQDAGHAVTFGGACTTEKHDRGECLRAFSVTMPTAGRLDEQVRLLGVWTIRATHPNSGRVGVMTETVAKSAFASRGQKWKVDAAGNDEITNGSQTDYLSTDIGRRNDNGAGSYTFTEPTNDQPLSVDDIFAQCLMTNQDIAASHPSTLAGGLNGKGLGVRTVQRNSSGAAALPAPVPIDPTGVIQFSHFGHADVEMPYAECLIGTDNYARLKKSEECKGTAGSVDKGCLYYDGLSDKWVMPQTCTNGSCADPDNESCRQESGGGGCYHIDLRPMSAVADSTYWYESCLESALNNPGLDINNAAVQAARRHFLSIEYVHDIFILDAGTETTSTTSSRANSVFVTGSKDVRSRFATVAAHEINHLLSLGDDYNINGTEEGLPWEGYAPCLTGVQAGALEVRNVMCADYNWGFPVNAGISMRGAEMLPVLGQTAADGVAVLPRWVPGEAPIAGIVNHCDYIRAAVDRMNGFGILFDHPTRFPYTGVSSMGPDGKIFTGHFYPELKSSLSDYNAPPLSGAERNALLDTLTQTIEGEGPSSSLDPLLYQPAWVRTKYLDVGPKSTSWAPPSESLSETTLNNDSISSLHDAISLAVAHPLSESALDERLDWIDELTVESDFRPLNSVIVRLVASDADHSQIASAAAKLWELHLLTGSTALGDAATRLGKRAPEAMSIEVTSAMLVSSDVKIRLDGLIMIMLRLDDEPLPDDEAEWILDRLDYSLSAHNVGPIEAHYIESVRARLQ